MPNKKILLCDDDEGILDMLEILLEDSGYEIYAERNSLNVHKIIAEYQPDLLVLDLWMPVLSGDQLVRSIRKNPALQDLPVIIISASRDGQEIAANAGANEFLAKPFDISELLENINKYLLN